MSAYSRFLTGLVAAPHTPMRSDGVVNLDVIPRQADLLLRYQISGAFICGSTGESHSLTTAERMQVAAAWRNAAKGTKLKLIVHVGHNSIEDARALAEHASANGADAVSVMAPCYFKPGTVADLIRFCAPIANAAPALPFYFYDIPALTGVHLSMPEFLRQASATIPNLAGLKFTTTDLMALQQCLQLEDGRFNILFGVDEQLLPALALGAAGAVGSTYNYSAPLYLKMIAAFESGDLAEARRLQFKSVQLVQVLCQYGVLPAGKALMDLVRVPCGPVRPPARNLSEEQRHKLFTQVEALGILEHPAAQPARVA